LRESGDVIDDSILKQVIDREAAWAHSPAGRKQLRGEVAAYRASVRALLDLVRIGWRVEVDRGTLELLPPPRLCARLAPDQVRARKEETRRVLWPMVAEQLAHPEFRKFVRRLEQPNARSKTRSVLHLIASSADLAARLKRAKRTVGDKRISLLAKAVQPYLQLVTEDTRDPHTNLPLSDIWRYFRATWSIPNLAVPGRSMLYLVRDAAHAHHAVMGLIALNNAPMRKRSTDEWVGWTPGKLRFQAERYMQQTDAAAQLRDLIDSCLQILKDSASAICPDGLVTPKELSRPTAESARRLLTQGDQFDKLRAKALQDLDRQNRINIPRRDRKAHSELAGLDLPPLDGSLPDLEKATPDAGSRLARRLLVAKKRAYELSCLLQGQVIFAENLKALTNMKTAHDAWAKEEVTTALGIVCGAMKSARLSSNILEITTCGAIAPYHDLLGGKLAALLCFSPELGADYQDRYGGQPAIIRSHMANRPVPADCRLAALVTTSLYSVGSSQYERVRLPAGIIAPEQPELRIRHIGTSSGFGTVQFSTETSNEIDDFTRSHRAYVDVNSVFGEGPSPKLRKLRAGLDLLCFSADDLLKHHQMRLVYSLEFWPGATSFLRFGKEPTPPWVSQPQQFRSATQRIADFWRRRWLSMRLDHEETWERLQNETLSWKLSDRLPVARATIKGSPEPGRPPGPESPPPPPSGQGVYERLATRSRDLYSERLSDDDLERLHVTTDIDRFIVDKVQEGHSIVLTGNAGDGKSHLIRRLLPDLPPGTEIIGDATADMTNGQPEPVLNRIQRALNTGRRTRFVLGANEHQLLSLREAAAISATGRLAETFRSIEAQCRQRLAYGPVDSAAESAQSGVIVLDLSLRNPLSPNFARMMLTKLLGDDEVRARAASDDCVGRNHRRLSHPQVQERLMALFDRLAIRGERATVRQLWMILARAIFPPENGAAGDAPSSWYSEQIFDSKGKLAIDKLLARYADPAAHSHPRWDWQISENASIRAEDWLVDGPPIGVNFTRDPRHWFDSVKRRFYFEHRAGAEIFALETRAEREFRALLREGDEPDPTQLAHLLRGLNRLYCPPGFTGDDAELHLWQGLRYHEQPSRAYLASASLPRERFQLERPRPPARVAAAFGGRSPIYTPSHLVVVADCGGGTRRLLKLDYALFATLLKVAAGLPRHLVPESHIHRVDAFIERIGAMRARRGTEFRVFNAEDGTVAKISTTANRSRLDTATFI